MALGPPVAPTDGTFAVVASLLVGAAAIHVTARHVVYRDGRGMGFEHALLTALLGALVWALLAPIPLLGPALALLGWVAMLRWRYPGGWIRAAVTAAAAWAVAVLALAVLDLLGVGGVSALGVPGA